MNQPPVNICPLLYIADAASSYRACLEGACAWWDGNACAITAIAQCLYGLTNDGIVTYPAE